MLCAIDYTHSHTSTCPRTHMHTHTGTHICARAHTHAHSPRYLKQPAATRAAPHNLRADQPARAPAHRPPRRRSASSRPAQQPPPPAPPPGPAAPGTPHTPPRAPGPRGAAAAPPPGSSPPTLAAAAAATRAGTRPHRGQPPKLSTALGAERGREGRRGWVAAARSALRAVRWTEIRAVARCPRCRRTAGEPAGTARTRRRGGGVSYGVARAGRPVFAGNREPSIWARPCRRSQPCGPCWPPAVPGRIRVGGVSLRAPPRRRRPCPAPLSGTRARPVDSD